MLLKVASTTWRFARYYTGAPAYRRKGPPPVLLRLLGPVVVILTLVLLFSGVGLLVVSRPRLPLLLKVQGQLRAVVRRHDHSRARPPGRGVPAAPAGLVTALRALLRSWHHCGLLPADLSGAVPGVAPWGARRVVSAPSSGQVAAVLASCDQARTTGRRDFAILLMLARCGLRRSEVAALGLEDIDWRAGRITIRGKRHRIDVLPLAAVISSFQDRHVVDLGGHVEDGVVDVTAVAA